MVDIALFQTLFMLATLLVINYLVYNVLDYETIVKK